MRLITGDETGLLKDVWVENNSATIFGDTLYQNRAEEVSSLCWSNPGSQLIAARKSKVVETWECSSSSNKVRGTWTTSSIARDLPSQPISISALSSGGHVSFCGGGEVCITDEGSVKGGNRAIWHTRPTHKNKGEKDSGGEIDQNIMKSRNWRDNGRNIADHKISCGTVDGAGQIAAAGGMEHDTCLMDLETGQITWQAKNVKHDNLQLRQPVWVTGLDFMPGANGVKESKVVVIGTAFKQIRLYDTRSKTKRPTLELKEVGEYGITSLVITDDGKEAIYGDKGGGVHPVDLRNMRSAGVFTGPMGSVRSLQLHPKLPYLAAVGLDRTARVFNVSTHKLVHTSYLRQRLSAVLFDPQGVVQPKQENDQNKKNKKRHGSDESGSDSDSDDFGLDSDQSVEYYEDEMEEEEEDEDDDEEEEEEGTKYTKQPSTAAATDDDDDEQDDNNDDEEDYADESEDEVVSSGVDDAEVEENESDDSESESVSDEEPVSQPLDKRRKKN